MDARDACLLEITSTNVTHGLTDLDVRYLSVDFSAGSERRTALEEQIVSPRLARVRSRGSSTVCTVGFLLRLPRLAFSAYRRFMTNPTLPRKPSGPSDTVSRRESGMFFRESKAAVGFVIDCI